MRPRTGTQPEALPIDQQPVMPICTTCEDDHRVANLVLKSALRVLGSENDNLMVELAELRGDLIQRTTELTSANGSIRLLDGQLQGQEIELANLTERLMGESTAEAQVS
jgi:hypothetical protein